MAFDRDRPYNDLPSLPPPVPLETVRTLKAAIGANRALAELRSVGDRLPNQSILLRSVILQEARQSSAIENIVTTNDRLYRAFSSEVGSADPHTREVLYYERALWHGFERLRERPLATNLLIELVSIITQHEAGVRNLPGTRIAVPGGATIYTPPDGEDRLRALLADLDRFIHADDGIDPLIRLAAMHYQLEAIHPFGDGNGRTGRIANILYLVEKGLLRVPVLYLSRYLKSNKRAYYEGLRRVTEEAAWEDWVCFMLRGIEETATATRDRMAAILDLRDASILLVQREARGIYSRELIDLVFEQPFCRIQAVERAGIAGRQTASRYLRELERIGLLESMRAGREVLYVNRGLFSILTG